jgi:hypothetical protein
MAKMGSAHESLINRFFYVCCVLMAYYVNKRELIMREGGKKRKWIIGS